MKRLFQDFFDCYLHPLSTNPDMDRYMREINVAFANLKKSYDMMRQAIDLEEEVRLFLSGHTVATLNEVPQRKLNNLAKKLYRANKIWEKAEKLWKESKAKLSKLIGEF